MDSDSLFAVLQSFVNDPADSDYQRGYLACLIELLGHDRLVAVMGPLLAADLIADTQRTD